MMREEKRSIGFELTELLEAFQEVGSVDGRLPLPARSTTSMSLLPDVKGDCAMPACAFRVALVLVTGCATALGTREISFVVNSCGAPILANGLHRLKSILPATS